PADTNLSYSYNRYLAIAARAARNSLKEEKRLAYARHGELDLRFAMWQNGKQGHFKDLATENSKVQTAGEEGKQQ
ncbi:hypothetical protein KEM55_007569, partial [Ascosphaera atra]